MIREVLGASLLFSKSPLDKITSITFFAGKDILLKHKLLNILKKYFDSTYYYSPSDLKIDEIREEIENFSFFSTKKLFYIEDYQKLKKKRELTKILSKINENDIYIILSIQKKIEIPNDLKDSYTIVKIYPLNQQEALKYFTSKLKKQKISITTDIAIKIINAIGTEVHVLDNLIEKIKILEIKNIEDEEKLKEILEDFSKLNIFNLITYIFQKDEINLKKELKKYINSKENLIQFVSILATQLEKYLLLKTAIEEGENIEDAMRELLIPPSKKKETIEILKKLKYRRIMDYIDLLYHIDTSIKTGAIPYSEDILKEELISKLYLI